MDKSHYQKTSFYLWITYILLSIVFTVFFQNDITSDTSTYFQAGRHWLMGLPLYQMNKPFLYFPHTALIYSWLSDIPQSVYKILFPLITLAMICRGLYRIAMMNLHGALPTYFFGMSIAVMLLGFVAVLKGNLDLLITGLMLLAVAEILDERWWIAALYLVIGFVLDPKTLILLLLARSIFRTVFFKAVSLVLLFALLPFFFQKTAYVWQQYGALFHIWKNLDGSSLQNIDFFSLLHHFGWGLCVQVQGTIRIITGVAFFIFCFYVRLRFEKSTFCVLIYTIAAIFLLLFNPKSEFQDLIILAPALGYFTVYHYLNNDRVCFGVLVALTGLLFLSLLLSVLVNSASISCLPPLCVMIFSGYIIYLYFRQS